MSERSRVRLGRETGWAAVLAVTLVAVGGLVFRYPLTHGISNISTVDGLTQHFPALYHYHSVIRAFIADPSSGLAQWSWHLGLGAGSLGVLSYYVGDPFALLSLPFPTSSLETVYQALYLLRIFVAGMLSYGYLRRMRSAPLAAIAGSLGYVFVTFTLFSALRHPYFANALVYLPLLLWGVERLLTEHRPRMFVFAVFLAAVSNFYFFYQLSTVVVIYAVARWFEVTPPGERRRLALPFAGRFLGSYLVGAALAGALLVPVVIAFFGSSRSGEQQPVGLFHGIASYGSYIRALTTSYRGTKSVFGGFSVVGFLVLPTLFMRRREHTALKVMIVAFAVFLAFPFFGKAFNGFSFPSYRFLFMWGLFLAAGAGAVLSDRRVFSHREIAAMASGLGVYSLLLLVVSRSLSVKIIGAPLFGAVALALLAVERRVAGRRPDGSVGEWSPWLRAAIGAIVVVNVVWMGATSFEPRYSARLEDYLRRGRVMEMYRRNQGSLAANLPGDGFHRIDKQVSVLGSDLNMTSGNDALIQGHNGVEYYFSIFDGHLFDYLRGLDVRSMRMSFDYAGLDDRAVLDTLNGVRYYLASTDATAYAPFGFRRASGIDGTVVYENTHRLPLGYVYHAAIPYDGYGRMTPLERQQAMLRGVVLEDGDAPALPRTVPSSEVVVVPYAVEVTAGVLLDPTLGSMVAETANADARLRFDPVPDAELYVEMTGMRFRLAPRRLPPVTGVRSFLKRLFAEQTRREQEPSDVQFMEYGTDDRPSKAERIEQTGHAYHWGDDTQLVNLGYFQSGADQASIRMRHPGTVRFDALNVLAVPMTDHAERVADLADEALVDVRVGVDRVSGNVTSDGDGLLFLSVPYSSGWRATVDGRPAKVIRANVGFCGIAVGDGSHRIVMRYETPGLKLGGMLSLLGLIAAGWTTVRAAMAGSAGRSAPL